MPTPGGEDGANRPDNWRALRPLLLKQLRQKYSPCISVLLHYASLRQLNADGLEDQKEMIGTATDVIDSQIKITP
jgi:hypothetical protein